MATFDELRAKASKSRASARVLLDAALLAEHAALDAEAFRAAKEDALHNRPPESPALAQRLAELEERIAAAEDEFSFEGIGTIAWYELIAAHPPDGQQKKARLDSNWRTFRPAAVAASCVDPVLTVEDATWLMETLQLAEWEKLWFACMQANVGADDRPKSLLASTARLLNERSSATASNEGSLAEPSSAVNGDQSPLTSTTPTAS